MIIVTGGAGFIGSNIVKALNDKGITDILVVDNLKDGTKFVNWWIWISQTIWIRKTSWSRLWLAKSSAMSKRFSTKARALPPPSGTASIWWITTINTQGAAALLHGAWNPVPVRFFRSHLRRTHLRLYWIPRVRKTVERLRLLKIPVWWICSSNPAWSELADCWLPLFQRLWTAWRP